MTSVGTFRRRRAGVRSPETTVGDFAFVVGVGGGADDLRGAHHLPNHFLASDCGRAAEPFAQDFRRGLSHLGIACCGHQRDEGAHTVRVFDGYGLRNLTAHGGSDDVRWYAM